MPSGLQRAPTPQSVALRDTLLHEHGSTFLWYGICVADTFAQGAPSCEADTGGPISGSGFVSQSWAVRFQIPPL